MDAQAYRDANKAKAHRLANAKYEKADSSDWTPSEPMNNGVKTGMRPVSKQAAYRDGGKVIGECAEKHHFANGGKAMTPDNYANRDMKEANESRAGKKHDGGMRNGGAAKKDGGGTAVLRTEKMPSGAQQYIRGDGRAAKDDTVQKYQKAGVGDPAFLPVSEARQDNLEAWVKGKKSGGRAAHAEGGKVKEARTNINIVIAPAGGQQPPASPGLAPPPMMAPKPPMPPQIGAPAPMGGMPAPMMARKSGGKVYPLKDGAGGGLGRLAKARAYGPEGFKGKLP